MEPGDGTTTTRASAFLRRHAAAIGVAVLAVLLRLPTVFNGLPYIRHPDEPVNYSIAHTMVKNRTLLPHFYDYPSLQYDIQSVVHAGVAALGKAFGAWGSMDDLGLVPRMPLGSKVVLNSEPFIAARLATLVVSVAGVLLVVLLARRLTRSTRWAAAAGVLAAFSGIGVANGSVITPDALAGTMALLAMYPLVVIHLDDGPEPDTRWALLTGALIGGAVGAKYNNALLVGVVVVSVLLLERDRRPDPRRLMAMAGAAAVAFVVTTPGALFDMSAFLHDVRSVTQHYSKGHSGAEGSRLTANLGFLWSSDAVAVIGAALAIALSRVRTTWVLAAWTVGYVAITGLPKVHFARNLTPVLGSLAVLAAVGLQIGAGLLRQVAADRKVPWRSPRALAVAAAVLIVPMVAFQVVRTADELRRGLTDYQAQSREWLDAHLEPNAKVLIENYTPWLDREKFRVTGSQFVADQDEASWSRFDSIVLTSPATGVVEAADVEKAAVIQQIRASACRIDRFEDDWGFWIEIVQRSCS